jgi:hypothetical protein
MQGLRTGRTSRVTEPRADRSCVLDLVAEPYDRVPVCARIRAKEKPPHTGGRRGPHPRIKDADALVCGPLSGSAFRRVPQVLELLPLRCRAVQGRGPAGGRGAQSSEDQVEVAQV